MSPRPEQPELRPAHEVQRAHDMLVGCLLDPETVTLLGPELAEVIGTAANACCWILRHDDNPNFVELLQAVELLLWQRGIVLEDSGHLNYPEEP